MNKMQKGFTLIELMIVVAIIAILAAIAIPQYQNYVARSQMSRAMSESGSLKTAVEDCLTSGDTDCPGATIESDLGTVEATAETDGTIVFTFGENVSAQIGSGDITWTRDASSGAWSCTTSVAEAAVVPKGCEQN